MRTFEVILKNGERITVEAKDIYMNDIGIELRVRFIEPSGVVYVDGRDVSAINEVKKDAC